MAVLLLLSVASHILTAGLRKYFRASLITLLETILA
jgi:hypothetical protein